MTGGKKDLFYKIIISLIFGFFGFFANFHTIIFHFGDFTIAVLFGLLFPLMITLSWGWKFGLLSALAGGCQTMWWLWGPSNGYAVFTVVPTFTFWILWHGIFSDLRAKSGKPHNLMNIYVVEIPFRLLSSLSILTLSRWAISKNPPPWLWAADSVSTIPMKISLFVIIKQASIGFVLLLIADVLLNLNPVRAFFRLKPYYDQKRTGYVVSSSLLLGFLYWFLESFFYAFSSSNGRSFIDYLFLDIPSSNLFTRIMFLLFCLAFGTAMSRIMRKQKSDELQLRDAREEAVGREALLRALFQTLPDQVWLKDLKGNYISCNKRVEALFGVEESQIIGKNDYDLIDPERAGIFEAQDMQTIKEGKEQIFEMTQTFASDGHQEINETIKAPMYDDKGNVMGVLGISRDISLRSKLQRQLIQAQKMESIGRLAGGVAHDFNNMITVILGVSQMIMDNLPEGDSLSESMNSILSAAKRSGNLTKQLLTFARQQQIKPSVIEVNNAVEDILKLLRRLIGENINLEWTPSADTWKIKADNAQIDQVLANLCVNASDAIKGNGKISIASSNKTFDSQYCSIHKTYIPGDYVMLSVSDSGSGMTKDDQEHIFEPFYTTKQTGKGTGLGLATVYGIMKLHDGFINVYSEPGRGSTFKLYFPRYAGEDSEESISEDFKNPTKGSETILLVEDEQEILTIVKLQLEAQGYTVLSFSNSKEAVEHSGNEQNIKLLISDVIMPGLNGKEVLQEVRKSHPQIKCLFISGYTADVISEQGVLDEGVSFLNKPFSGKELAFKVREVLDVSNQSSRDPD